MHTLIYVNYADDESFSMIVGKDIISKLRSRVSLLTVIPDKESTTTSKQLLSNAADQLGVEPIAAIVRRGDPASEIIAQIHEKTYDLLILETDQSRSVEKFITGSVIQRVVTQSNISVLAGRGLCTDIHHILIATSGYSTSEPTIFAGARMARALDAEVTLLHVTDYYPGMYAGLSRFGGSIIDILQSDTPISNHLKSSAELFKSLGIEANIELRHGLPEEQIIRASDSGLYDLLVIGKSAQGILNRMLRPELSSTLIDNVICPILVVKNTLGATRPLPSEI